MFASLREAYRGVADIFRRYWRDYGGWRALAFSPYFHFAILLTAILSRFWLKEIWWDVALEVLPSIIGFALGGYAVWLGFGDEKFRHLISEREIDGNVSPYLQVSAAFAHFIIVQLIALVAALIAKGTNFSLTADHWLGMLLLAFSISLETVHRYVAPVFYGIGFLLFIYALTTAVAATLAVFRVASWFDRFRNS